MRSRAAALPLADVRRAAMLSGDLCETARLALSGGRAALDSIHLQVMRPVQPMLAASAESVAEALAATGPRPVEWKLDGAIQVHRAGDDVRVFTRNLNDVTERLPDVVAAVRLLGPRGARARRRGDRARRRRAPAPLPGDDEPVRSQRLDVHGIPLTALFFDCLRFEDLITHPLSERIERARVVRWRPTYPRDTDGGSVRGGGCVGGGSRTATRA